MMSEKEKTSDSTQHVMYADWVKGQLGTWEQAWKQTAQVGRPPSARPCRPMATP